LATVTTSEVSQGGRTAAFVALGAVAGFVATLAFVYIPLYLAGNGYYEHTDSLLGMSVLLVPLGALIGAVSASVRPSNPRKRSRARSGILVGAFLVALWVLWELWSVVTGAPSLL
jgi:hypothetical protein